MPTETHDAQNRPYAKLSELKPGSIVIVDGGFGCMKAWSEREVKQTQDEIGKYLYLECRSGIHAFNGQIMDDGDTLIGIYHKEGFKK